MKAFLLAAGLGTRLRPITDSLPKCLIQVAGRPLLDIWLDALAAAGVDEVLVNVHHLPGLVRHHVQARTGPPVIHISEEPQLRGSAGTLRANRHFVADEAMFLAINADNLTDFDPQVLIEAHRTGGRLATLSLFHAPRPSECGIVTVRDGLMVGFVEKPVDPPGDLANAGMYALHARVLDEITGPDPQDIGYDLLPRLVGRAWTVTLDGSFFIDIGSPAALAKARHEWEGRRVP